MQFPIIVLSYGEFTKTKKLFIYEKNGVLIFPIFNDIQLSLNFKNHMNNMLLELGDGRSLELQVCNEAATAIDIFKIISTIIPDLTTITIDPTINGDDIVEANTLEIDEVIEQIQSCLSNPKAL